MNRGLTILGSCDRGPWLVSHRIASWEWESFPRREPKPARERLGPLRFINATQKKKWRGRPI
jgi:hypothetical protein